MAYLNADNHQAFQEYRTNGWFIDCILQTEDGSQFPVHQIVLILHSQYFYDRVIDPNRPTIENKTLLCMDGISSAILKILLDLMYFQTVQMTCEEAKEVLIWSDRFKMPDISDVCCQQLEKSLHLNNCIGIHKLAVPEHCRKFARKVETFLLRNFMEIFRDSQEFLNLTHQELSELLARDHLGVKNELETYQAIEKWMGHDPGTRRPLFGTLFRTVRLGRLNGEQLLTLSRNANVQALLGPEDKEILARRIQASGEGYQGMPRLPYEVPFVVGGWTSGYPTNYIETFDVRANRWNVLARFTDVDARAYHGVEFLDGLIYTIGGFDGSHYYSSVRCFNLEDEVWIPKSCMYIQRCYVSTCILNGLIYALGGYNGQTRLDSAERYTPATNQWTMIAPMRRQRSDASAISFQGRVYIAGGFTGHDVLDSVEYYDPANNTWTLLTNPMSTPRSGVSLLATDTNLYVMGGFNGTQRLHSAEKYDAFYERWVPISNMITPRSNFTTFLLEGKIYAVGGFDGTTTIALVEYYEPTSDTWTSAPSMAINRSAMSSCVARDVMNLHVFVHSAVTGNASG